MPSSKEPHVVSEPQVPDPFPKVCLDRGMRANANLIIIHMEVAHWFKATQIIEKGV